MQLKGKQIVEDYWGLLFLLLASLSTVIKIPGLNLAIHNFLIPVISLAIILINFQRQLFVRHIKSVGIVFLFIIWCWISFIFSEHKNIAFIYTFKYFYYVLIFIALLLITDSKNHNLKLCNLVIGFLLAIAVLGIMEYFFPNSWLFKVFKDGNFYPRTSSLLQNPNSFGVLMAVGTILNFIICRNFFNQTKYFLFISELIFLVAIALSGSRNAWLILTLGCFLLLQYKVIKFKNFIGFGIIFFLTVLLIPAAKYRLGLGQLKLIPFIDFTNNAIADQLPSPTGTAFSRFLLWKLALNEIIKHPITGLGIGVFSEHISIQAFGKSGFNVHNLFLNILVDLGIPGFLIFIIGIIKLFHKFRSSEAWIVIPLIMFFCSQLVDFFIYDLTFMIIEIMFICFAINYRHQVRQSVIYLESKKSNI